MITKTNNHKTIILIVTLFSLNNLLFRNLNFLTLIEFLIILSLVVEDEINLEVSLYKLILLFVIKLIILYLNDEKIYKNVILFSNTIYFGIYFISKGNFGIGDVFLNGIMTLNYSNVFDYFRFFTTTFTIGAIFSLIVLIRNRNYLNFKVGFIKYLAIGYYFSNLIGGSIVF